MNHEYQIYKLHRLAYFTTGYKYVSRLIAEPSDHEIRVQNLRPGGFVEDESNNTFSVQFTWKAPHFNHSNVDTYTVSYEFYGGYSREQLACSPLTRDGSGCFISELVS